MHWRPSRTRLDLLVHSPDTYDRSKSHFAMMIPYAQTPNPNDTVNSTRTQGRIELEHTKQSFDLLRTGLNLVFLLRLEQGNIHAPNKTPANRT